jgi:hypothetical protein
MKKLWIFLLLITPLAVAQEYDITARERTLKEQAVAEATDPEPRAVGVILPKALTIDLSEKDKKSSVSGSFKQGNLALSAKLTAPIDDADQPVVFGDLTGLTAKTIGEGKLTYISWKPRIDRLKLSTSCRDLKNGRRRFKGEQLLGPNEPVGCRDDEFESADNIAPEDLAAARRLFWSAVDRGIPWFYSFSLEGGRQNYKWIDRTALSDMKESQTSRAVVFSVSTLRKNDDFLSLAYRKATDYEAGKPTQLCVPLAEGSPALVCKTTALDAPTKKDAEVVVLQYRRFFTESLAISPKVARDIKSNITQIDLPIYFFRNPTGGLTGGAAASWRSDEKEITARIFVGAALKLIN